MGDDNEGSAFTERVLSSLDVYWVKRLWYFSLITLYSFGGGAFAMMNIVFIGGQAPFKCIPSGLNRSLSYWDIDNTTLSGYTVSEDQCSYTILNGTTNSTKTCSNWAFEKEFGETIVSEWGLVCSYDSLVEISQSIFSSGIIVGACFWPFLADKYGRKPIIIVGVFFNVVLGTCSMFTQNIVQFIVLRTLFTALGANVGMVYMSELYPARQRSLIMVVCEFYWCFPMAFLSVIAYFIRDWRFFALATNLPPVYGLLFYFILPESVVWLIANDRWKELGAVLSNFYKMPVENIERLVDAGELKDYDDINGIDPAAAQKIDLIDKGAIEMEPDVELERFFKRRSTIHTDNLNNNTHLESGKPVEKRDSGRLFAQNVPVTGTRGEQFFRGNNSTRLWGSEAAAMHKGSLGSIPAFAVRRVTLPISPESVELGLFDLLKSRIGFTYLMSMSFLGFVNSFLYMGLSYASPNLPGDRYVNFALSALSEAPCYAVAIPLMKYCGRRWPCIGFLFLCGFGFFLGSIITTPELILAVNILAKFGITGSYAVIILWAPEIYPTNVRAVGLGFSSIFTCIGTSLAPLYSYLARVANASLVMQMSGGLSLLGIVACVLLPETNNRALPNTIEDLRVLNREGGIKCPKLRRR